MDEHFADFKSKQLTSDDLHELMARPAVGGAAINGLLIATAVHCVKSQRERERGRPAVGGALILIFFFPNIFMLVLTLGIHSNLSVSLSK